MNGLENKPNVSIESVEKTRKDLGVSQKFIAKCIGTHEANYSRWKVDTKTIPSKYRGPIIDVLNALKHLADGDKLMVVKTTEETSREHDQKIQAIEKSMDMLSNMIRSVTDDITASGLVIILQRIKAKIEEL